MLFKVVSKTASARATAAWGRRGGRRVGGGTWGRDGGEGAGDGAPLPFLSIVTIPIERNLLLQHPPVLRLCLPAQRGGGRGLRLLAQLQGRAAVRGMEGGGEEGPPPHRFFALSWCRLRSASVAAWVAPALACSLSIVALRSRSWRSLWASFRPSTLSARSKAPRPSSAAWWSGNRGKNSAGAKGVGFAGAKGVGRGR